MKILIVDDSKAMRLIVMRTLKQAGYTGHEILEATSGVTALEQIAQHTPDIVFSDWNMPEMNGLELLRNLRNAENNIKFGFISSEATEDMRQMAIESGALFFITKPFTPETFESVLKIHL